MPKLSPAERARIEQRRLTVAANILAGLPYRDMAIALGVSLGTIASDAKAVFKEWRSQYSDTAENVRSVHSARIARAVNAIWTKIQAGDLAAIDRLVSLLKREAEMLGLDEPEKKEITGKGGGAIEIIKVYEGIDMDKV